MLHKDGVIMINLNESKQEKSYEERCSEYNTYLREHIKNVKISYERIIREIILRDFDVFTEKRCAEEIEKHDQSKYSTEEYNAYLDRFFPATKHKATKEEESAFDLAWLHHQKHNPHHWQYWVLLSDKSKNREPINAIDMPIEQIICMLCDWHSFSKTKPDSTAYAWYNEHKDEFILSKNTRKIIDKYLKYFKKPLAEIIKDDDNND